MPGLAVWAIWNTGCYTLPAAIQIRTAEGVGCIPMKYALGFLGLSRSMELWDYGKEGRIGNAGSVKKRHDKNVVTKYH